MRRVVWVAPPNSLMAGLADKTLEMVATLAQVINVPLLILSAGRYAADLRDTLEGTESQSSHEVVLLGKDVIRDVTRQVDAQDLVIMTTTGTRRRFRSGLGDLPERVATAVAGSMVVIHYP